MRSLITFLFIIGCAQSQVFGEDFEIGIASVLPVPDSLTFGFYPDSEFTSATVRFITSEMGDQWTEVNWETMCDGGDGVEFTLYDAPDTGWAAFHGWAEAPALNESEQLCRFTDALIMPAGEVVVVLYKPNFYFGYSSAQDGDNCILIFKWDQFL